MPWSRIDRPSAALAALAPYVQRERPTWTVSCHSEFLRVAVEIGKPLYGVIADAAYTLGDPLYCPALYPEKRVGLRRYVEGWMQRQRALAREEPSHRDVVERVDEIFDALVAHIDKAVSRLSPDVSIVGLTTCFGQLFGNLALARAIKQRLPGAKIVLGGSTISGRVGPSILREYPFIDYVIQGEGERPLVGLLEAFESEREPAGGQGLLSRTDGVVPEHAAQMLEVPNMDDLPMPDYDEFDASASEADVDWVLPVEGSRGCWWDRTKRAGNPRATCYFCNLNMQWSGYREKSARRTVEEVALLSERHARLRLYFLDNIIRHRGVVELAEGLKSLKKDFEIFYEARANLHPYECLVLREAGLRKTQFGIEALSNSLLRRIGKGTTVIQNLSAMRMCTELGIENDANLICGFPGSTTQEIQETRDVILSFAVSFTPLFLAQFHLGIESTVDVLRDEFGITNVRNEDFYNEVLPQDVVERLSLCDLSFDERTASADWSPVREALEHWRSVHRRADGPLLSYWDGGNFLIVEDNRGEAFSTGTFRGLEREIYLYCMEPRGTLGIQRHFDRRGVRECDVTEILERFVAYKIMYSETDGCSAKFLSLATAANMTTAAQRIRATWEEERMVAERSQRARPHVLP
jgi:ribosomal peptide maturation radical SAM protein 1